MALNLRSVSPELHRRLKLAAFSSGKALDRFCAEALEASLQDVIPPAAMDPDCDVPFGESALTVLIGDMKTVKVIGQPAKLKLSECYAVAEDFNLIPEPLPDGEEELSVRVHRSVSPEQLDRLARIRFLNHDYKNCRIYKCGMCKMAKEKG